MTILNKNLLALYLMIAVLGLGSSTAFSQVSLSIGIAPPPLTVEVQPACPDDGYIWTPGYWAYGDQGYYWVAGEWEQPPEIGLFWTPCYWGWGGNAYVFHSGYWGQHVGYYGGINYGYGYGGNGYNGGRWQGNHFAYNRAVNNVNSNNFHNTYMDRSAVTSRSNRVSYNGGNGGVQTRPTAQQNQYSNQRHYQSTSGQQAQIQNGSRDRGPGATDNGGNTATPAAAMPKSYNQETPQNAAAPYATHEATPRTEQGTPERSATGGSSYPETRTTPQAAPAVHHTQATAIHHEATKPESHSQTHTQSHTQTHTQSHSEDQAHSAKPQAH